MFTIGETRPISHASDQEQQAQHWLKIHVGEDFPTKFLWRTPTKIHREWRRGRQQETAKQKKHRLAQQRFRRQHSDHKHVQRQRQTTTTTLLAKPMKRGNTDCRRFKKRRGDQATLEVYSKNYLLRFNDRQQEVHDLYARQEYLSNGLRTADQPLHHKHSLLRRGLFVCCGEAGEKEKESARGTMGRGKREERPPVVNIYEEHLLDPVFLGN